ncbi:hypothetical protein OD350_28605 (plasmid) [Clostridium beijerinckii]|uniref:hypothetical protein n=1 Tax=Clostridium beijerinckii TaxID=1520 RepID=UPI00222654E0|nr:hypothetical protein [Clostridium beijerinckii]UYZ39035.1 hypothetical protein OD350_28605 [Clostridium beijerinckii]
MKAIFKLNNKTIENEKIENVSLLIMLGKKFKDRDDNEEYVINSLEKDCKIFDLDRFEIQCPCDDLVYLSNESFTGNGEEGRYPSNNEELQLLIKSYNEAKKVFGNDKVKISVYSNYLYENGNEDDFSLNDFLNNFKFIEN